MVESYHFSTDEELRNFLTEELKWDLSFGFPYEFEPREHPFEPEGSFSLRTDYLEGFYRWRIIFKVLFSRAPHPVELHVIQSYDRNRYAGAGKISIRPLREPWRTYPNLLTFFREMCQRPPDNMNLLGDSLLERLEKSGLTDRTIQILKKRVSMLPGILEGILPKVLGVLVTDYLRPLCREVVTHEIVVNYRVEEGFFIESTWGGETVIRLELLVKSEESKV